MHNCVTLGMFQFSDRKFQDFVEPAVASVFLSVRSNSQSNLVWCGSDFVVVLILNSFSWNHSFLVAPLDFLFLFSFPVF